MNIENNVNRIILEKPYSEKVLHWISFTIKILFFFFAIIIISSGLYGKSSFLEPGNIVTKYVGNYGESVIPNSSFNDIAWIKINGIIANSDYGISPGVVASNDILKMLDIAQNDDKIKLIVLQINSPGGTVLDAEKISRKINNVKIKKPVYALLDSVAASGGYYIASQCNKIFAYRETITGSIGVIMSIPNFSELASKIGVKQINITSGNFKSMGDPLHPMSDEEKGIFQEMVNDSYDQFIEIVSKGRSLDKNEVKKIADGRIYSGKQAFYLKLIDDLGGKDGLIEFIKKENISDFNILFFYIKKSGIEEILSPTSSFLGSILGINNTNISTKIMYLMN